MDRSQTTTAEIICGPDGLRRLLVPMIDSPVPAGIPEDYSETTISLTALYDHLIRHPHHTYALRAKGQSMTGDGINSGDILIVDRAMPRKSSSIIIAEVDGSFTVKKYEHENGKLILVPSNPAFPRIPVRPHQQCTAWGVVTFAIKPMY